MDESSFFSQQIKGAEGGSLIQGNTFCKDKTIGFHYKILNALPAVSAPSRCSINDGDCYYTINMEV